MNCSLDSRPLNETKSVPIHNLINQYKEKVAPLCNDGSTAHFSVFAFAPQPLLIKLGALLGDAHAMDIYQRHRKPPSWRWQLPTETVIYKIIPPAEDRPTVALNISLSAPINNERIYKTLGANCSVWTITIDSPNLHFVCSPTQLAAFRQIARSVYDEVNFKYDQQTPLHVFPAMPNSLAIEFGRSRLPKVDVPLVILENFADRWKDSPRKATLFFDWVNQARMDIGNIVKRQGLFEVASAMKPVFGETMVNRAVNQFGEQYRQLREEGSLRMLKSTGILTTASGIKVPNHTFHGRS